MQVYFSVNNLPCYLRMKCSHGIYFEGICMNEVFVVAALYRFNKITHVLAAKKILLDFCGSSSLKGTLLLANEGINGTVCGVRKDIDQLKDLIEQDIGMGELEYKESFATKNPFLRMKIKLKNEIVTLGVCGVDPSKMVGEYIEPENWNDLISDPEVLLIDTRNDYEYEIGSFIGAVNPNTQTFREFPEYIANNVSSNKYKRIAMFCTGGIRCEKASSYMMEQQFENIYHLKGGVLNYFEKVPAENSLWQGECFVFDERVAVNHKLEPGKYDQCYGCRYPLTEKDKESTMYLQGVSCHRCYNETSEVQKQSFAERHKQIMLAKERGKKHLGDNVLF